LPVGRMPLRTRGREFFAGWSVMVKGGGSFSVNN
jgi:hypothetical protein